MKIKFIILFIILSSCSYIFLDYEKDTKIEQNLATFTKQYKIKYNSVYNKFKEKSNLIFDTLIQNDKVTKIYQKLQTASQTQKDILRDELYLLLKDIYGTLKYTKLKQLHFHLSNNDSFLRLHKPTKYGDNLSGIRETIEYVNKYNKKIDGFEAGRVVSGFRFVYPIEDKNNNHLGSVEVSFSIDIFSIEFMEDFKVLSNFRISKEIINKKTWNIKNKHYKQSSFDGFYDVIRVINNIKDFSKKHQVKKSSTNNEFRKKVTSLIFKGQAVSLYHIDSQSIRTFLPIKNPITKEVVAFLSIKTKAQYIINKYRNFYFIVSLVTLLIAVVLVLIYKELKYKENLEREVKKKTEALNAENEKTKLIFNSNPAIIIVTDGKNISEVNQMFFEYFGFKSLKEFNLKYNCICELFIDKKDTPHLMPDMYGLNWTKYIEKNPDKINVAYLLDKYNNEKIFEVKISDKTLGEKNEMIVILTDMTEIFTLKKDLEVRVKEEVRKNIEKEKRLLEQSKMASMGEMIGNIAHQWRQPLSVISTAASGIKMEKEYDILSDESHEKYLDGIIENTQYLSKTIDSFKDFIQDQKELKDVVKYPQLIKL